MRARLLLAAPALLVPVALSLPAAGAEHGPTAVTIKSYAYGPNPFTVHVGDTVVWTNQDTAPHTVTSVSGPTLLDSPQFGKGGTWTWTATTAGTYRYYCAVHPDMKAGFTVLPAAAPAAPVAPVATRAAAPAAPVVATTTKPAAARAATSAPVVTAPSTAAAQVDPGSTPAPVAASTAAAPKALDPTLLLVALTAGAVLTALLALGRAVRP